MPSPITRYELDITGSNPDNLVSGELHNLTDRTIRAITPIHGPFFAESIKLYDNSNGRPLSRGTDYQCVELLQDATLQYGKEICSVILIINTEVSPEIRLNYQVLGGAFTSDSTAIANLYETVMQDNRPVQWENVLNKPLEYPPALHRHLLEDLYGFEPVVAALERIRNALLLSDVPAFEALIDWVHSKLKAVTCKEALRNIPVPKIVTYDKLLVVFTRMYLLSNFRFDEIPERVHEGSAFNIRVLAKEVPDDTVIYWRIIHEGTDQYDFLQTSGQLTIKDNQAYIPIQLIMDEHGELPERFSIGLLERSHDEEYIGVSCHITISDATAAPDNMTFEQIFDCIEHYTTSDTRMTPAWLFMSCVKDADPLVHPSYRVVVEGDMNLTDSCQYCTTESMITPVGMYLQGDKAN